MLTWSSGGALLQHWPASLTEPLLSLIIHLKGDACWPRSASWTPLLAKTH